MTKDILTNIVFISIISIILLTVGLGIYAELIPEAQSAGNSLNSTGVPLGSLFTANSVIFIIIMVSIFIISIGIFLIPKFFPSK